MRVFLDANVLFAAAHNPDGKAALLITLGLEGHWEVVTSTLAVEEARHNIMNKYPQALPALERLEASMKKVKSGTGQKCPVPLSDKDRPILESAVNCGATHLVTGDVRHFGPYMNRPDQTGGVMVLTVSEFLSSILAQMH